MCAWHWGKNLCTRFLYPFNERCLIVDAVIMSKLLIVKILYKTWDTEAAGINHEGTNNRYFLLTCTSDLTAGGGMTSILRTCLWHSGQAVLPSYRNLGTHLLYCHLDFAYCHLDAPLVVFPVSYRTESSRSSVLFKFSFKSSMAILNPDFSSFVKFVALTNKIHLAVRFEAFHNIII